MSKILKNQTLSDIELDVGITVPASGQVTLNPTEYLDVASSTDIDGEINLGNIVVNDGTNDLNSSDGINYLKYPDQAANVLFDNSSNNFNANDVQTAIEELKRFRVQTPQFQLLQSLNFDEYFYAFKDANGPRSGNNSNGYEFGGAAPVVSLYSGTVISASAAIKGLAVSTGSPASSVNLQLELWKVGFNGQGSKLGDIEFDIDSSQFTIGTFWNSSVDSDYEANQIQNVSVTAGDLLALKFIRQTGSSGIVEIRNATVVLEIEGSA